MSDTEIAVNAAPTRSKRTAYMWLLTIFFGAHRIYLGKWLSALLYPVSILVLIPLEPSEEILGYFSLAYLVMLVVDACFIPRWVRQRNEWYAEDFREHPNRYLIPDSDDIAPWARGQSKKGDGSLRSSAYRVYFFFWIVPLFTGVWAAQLQSLEVLMIPIVVIIAIGLIGTLDQMLEHQPALLEIPGVGPALERVAEMRAYYWDNEPKISSAVWGLFRHWKDYKPYWTLALVVAVTVIIEGIISYDNNTRFIEPVESVKIVGIAALIAAIVVLINLVPITALSFHYSLSGKRTRLRFMTVGAVVATIFGFYIPSITTAEEGEKEFGGKAPTLLSEMRLDSRMKDPEFRNALIVKMDVFLWYYINEGIDEGQMNDDFRNLLVGLAPNDESDAFEIIEYEDVAAVVYYSDDPNCKFIDENGAEDLAKGYSLLAVVQKNTDEIKMLKLQDYGDFQDLDDEQILEAVDHVSSKNIYYGWDEALNPYVEDPECRVLICDEGAGCPGMEDG